MKFMQCEIFRFSKVSDHKLCCGAIEIALATTAHSVTSKSLFTTNICLDFERTKYR